MAASRASSQKASTEAVPSCFGTRVHGSRRRPIPTSTKVCATGSLKFILHGEKLKGKWALIRMGGKAANERKPNWLLIKEHDDFERKSDDPPITEEEPNSVVTGRSIEEIAKSEDHVWNSKETASGNAWYRKENGETSKGVDALKRKLQTSAAFTAALKGTPKEKLPDFVTPQLATQATDAAERQGMAP